MTVTYSGTTITFTESTISDFTNIDTVTLTTQIGCTGTKYTNTITDPDVDGSGIFSLTSTDIFSSDTLADGVYNFKLTIEYSDATATAIKYACLFVDEEFKCDLVDKVNNCDCLTDDEKLEAKLDYYLIKEAQTCTTDCADLCDIYNRLVNVLDCDCC